MACRFIALDNAPGVNPVGIREIIRHLRSKYFLLVKCTKAMEACKNINLYAGLGYRIEGAVHVTLVE